MTKYTYRYEGDRVHFRFPYSPEIIKEVRDFAGAYWENENKEWVVPITNEDKIIDFMELYGFEFVDNTEKVAEQKLEYTPVDISFVKGQLSMLDLPFEPRQYQLETIAYGLDKRKYINALDMGLGKSFCSTMVAELAKGYPCLIVTPSSVKYQFALEFKRFTGRTAAVIESKETKKRVNDWNADVVVINYDILGKMVENGKFDKRTGKPKKSLQLRFEQLTDIKWKSCIFDECHFLRNAKAARSKAAAKIVKPIEQRQFLTGTPVSSKPKDLINLLKLIGRFEDISNGYNSFVRTYCGAKYEFGRLNTDGASNLIQLNQKLRDNCYIRFERRDVLSELPDVTTTIINTPFSSNREYNKAVSNFYDYMLEKGGEDAAELTVGAQETLMLMNTLMTLSIEAKMKFIEQYIKDWVEGDEKLVIFGMHREPLLKLHEKFGGGLIVGGVDAKKKLEAVAKFNEEGDQLIFVNVKAGGTGTNGLQDNCSNAIFLEPPLTPDDLNQAVSRLDRSGQKQATNINMLFNMDGIDGYIWNDILLPKSEVADAANKGIDISVNKDGLKNIAKKLFKDLQVGKK